MGTIRKWKKIDPKIFHHKGKFGYAQWLEVLCICSLNGVTSIKLMSSSMINDEWRYHISETRVEIQTVSAICGMTSFNKIFFGCFLSFVFVFVVVWWELNLYLVSWKGVAEIVSAVGLPIRHLISAMQNLIIQIYPLSCLQPVWLNAIRDHWAQC